jgi:hypothetical protein
MTKTHSNFASEEKNKSKLKNFASNGPATKPTCSPFSRARVLPACGPRPAHAHGCAAQQADTAQRRAHALLPPAQAVT